MATEPETNLVSKLSIKTMGCKPERAKSEDKSIPLYRVIGIATGVKQVKDVRGEMIFGATGNFEGVNLETGEVYQSGVLYLPGGAHELLISALQSEDAESVEFALEVSAEPAKNPIGYSYKARMLEKPKMADPLIELRKHLAGVKALPAPKARK